MGELMKKILATYLMTALFVSGCLAARVVAPPPVLAAVETKNKDITSKGGPLTPGELFVCMDIDGTGGMTCISYELFMEQLRKQTESKPSFDL